RRELAKEMRDLFDMGVHLEFSDSSGLIAHFQVRPRMIDEIKANQDRDPSLVRSKDQVQTGQALGFYIIEGVLRHGDKLCVLDVDGLRQKIMYEAHYALYSVHLGATKMYHDIKAIYWWFGMKKDVAKFVAMCLTCQQVKFEHQRPTRLF